MNALPSVPEVMSAIEVPLAGIKEYLCAYTEDRDGRTVLMDSALGAPASDCVHLQAAAGLDLYACIFNDESVRTIADRLRDAVLSRQSEGDWFSIPYNAPAGSRGEFDLVEIGASCLGMLSASSTATAEALVTAAAHRVAACRSAEITGHLIKSKKSETSIIPNAQAYGMLALSVADAVASRETYSLLRSDIVRRLENSIASWPGDAWPYSMKVTGEATLGYSLAYQATTIAYIDLARVLNETDSSSESWTALADRGAKRVLADLGNSASKETESAPWARNWSDIWEIRLLRFLRGDRATRQSVLDELRSLEGSAYVDSAVEEYARSSPDAARNPSSTALRKIANLGHILRALATWTLATTARTNPSLNNHPLLHFGEPLRFSMSDIETIRSGKAEPLTAHGVEVEPFQADSQLVLRGRLLADAPHARSAVILTPESQGPLVQGFAYSTSLSGYFKYLEVDRRTGRFEETIDLLDSASTPRFFIRAWRPRGPAYLEMDLSHGSEGLTGNSRQSSPAGRDLDVLRRREIPSAFHDNRFIHESESKFDTAPFRPGVHSIRYGDRWLDFLYKDRGADVTIVAFNAAISHEQTVYPTFSGRAYSSSLGTNLISFFDPSSAQKRLATFWYLDTPRIDVEAIITKVLRRLEDGLGQRLLFVGASAGGAAALRFGAKFPRSQVMVMNPRIDPRRSPERYDQAVSAVWSNDAQLVHDQLPMDVAEVYACLEGAVPKIWYLQNTGDKVYFDNHYLRFREMAHKSKLEIEFVEDYWGDGHVVPPKDIYMEQLRNIIDRFNT